MSGSLYVPDQSAKETLLQPWDEAFRAQRDVGLLVPMNFLTMPVVSLRAACFNNGLYEDTSFQKCFSNLLAVGLRRFVIDTYWDAPRREWSLCPAQMPPADAPATSSPVASADSSSLAATSVGATASISPTGLRNRQDASSGASPAPTTSVAASSSLSSESASSIASSSSASGTPTSSTVIPNAPGQAVAQVGNLFQLGSYNCTSTMTLGSLTGILHDFLEATSTTTDASFAYLVLNVHAAAPWDHPTEPAQQPPSDQLPQAEGTLLSDVLKSNLTNKLYTPSKLASDRTHLSTTWNALGDDNQPRKGYYTVDDTTTGLSTPDGWPDEVYTQFHQFLRLLAITGAIDPQMAEYNLSLDADTIFPPDTLRPQPNVSFSPNGTLKTGCLFSASESNVTPSTNSSFAYAALPSSLSLPASPDLYAPIPEITNLTSCGISPFLNHSLAPSTASTGATAATQPLPYAALAHSSLWSWAPGEPLNATDPNSPGATGNRCAAAYTQGPHRGRWHVVDCTTPRRAACQDPDAPYSWRLSSQRVVYGDAATTACDAGFVFSVPHAPLENAHLLSVAAASADGADGVGADGSVLLNLNSLDIADCWVAETNASCPYQPPDDMDRTRVVVVPTVAAIIIFVCAALTFFVKCASNRREDKRGRRRVMRGGWEYEGVPS